MRKYGLPDECYILMGDYLEYSVREAGRHGFKTIHLCAQWAKMVKIAMANPQTHVRFGAIDVKKTVDFLNGLEIKVPRKRDFNTAREIFDYILSKCSAPADCGRLLQRVCGAAKNYAEDSAGGVPVQTCLVSYSGEILASSE
jgi:cobalt-precorrin-5B (C1)-methyltransferase